jgi:hypothetical protein
MSRMAGDMQTKWDHKWHVAVFLEREGWHCAYLRDHEKQDDHQVQLHSLKGPEALSYKTRISVDRRELIRDRILACLCGKVAAGLELFICLFVLSLHSSIPFFSHFSIRPSIPVLCIFLISISMVLYILFIARFLLKLALLSFSVIPFFPLHLPSFPLLQFLSQSAYSSRPFLLSVCTHSQTVLRKKKLCRVLKRNCRVIALLVKHPTNMTDTPYQDLHALLRMCLVYIGLPVIQR